MKAGRELDEKVYREVFKRDLPSIAECEEVAREVWKEQPRCEHFARGFSAHYDDDGTFHFDGYSVPRYSTDISAAWEVVEKMRTDKWWVSIHSLVDTPDAKWRCELRGLNHHWEPCYAAASTAPEAICLAALKAVGAL